MGLFEDGAYPGQVVEESTDCVKASFMTPIFLKGKKQFHLWKWPSQSDEQEIEKLSVLPIRPSLDISPQQSTRRNVVFQLINHDFVQKFID